MSILFKARGSSSFGLLIIRLVLGSLFLIAGAKKLLNIQGFIEQIKAYNIMPENLAFIAGFLLPFAEVLLGALFIIGFFTPIVSLLLSAMILSFIFTLGWRHDDLPFSYHFVFLACTLCTLFSGAGIFSFDALLDRKKKPEPIIPDKPVVVREEPKLHKEIEIVEAEHERVNPVAKDTKDPRYPHDGGHLN